MTSVAAIAIVLLLCTVPLLAIAAAARHSSLLAPISGTITVIVVGIAFLQTGLAQRGTLASTDIVRLLPAQPYLNRCEQTFDALLEARVVLERPTAERLVVSGALWDQLPANAQDALKACAQDLAPPESAGDDIAIIRR